MSLFRGALEQAKHSPNPQTIIHYLCEFSKHLSAQEARSYRGLAA